VLAFVAKGCVRGNVPAARNWTFTLAHGVKVQPPACKPAPSLATRLWGHPQGGTGLAALGAADFQTPPSFREKNVLCGRGAR
jgi:hypothetical protein